VRNCSEGEQFFDALPSLCDSEALEDPQRARQQSTSIIPINARDNMFWFGLMKVPKEVKQRRIIICVKAIDATSLLGPWWTLRRVLFGDWHGFSRSILFGLFVQSWKSISHSVTTFYAQYCMVSQSPSQVCKDAMTIGSDLQVGNRLKCVEISKSSSSFKVLNIHDKAR
jgi:hypothetical protein